MADIVKGNKEALMSHTKPKFTNQKDKVAYISRRQFIEDRLRVSAAGAFASHYHCS